MKLRSTIAKLKAITTPSQRSDLEPEPVEWSDASGAVEEEQLPHYDARRFCPVRVGQLIHNRYRVIAKLGFGSQGTTWLCHDARSRDYVAVKVGVALQWEANGLSFRSRSRELVASARCREVRKARSSAVSGTMPSRKKSTKQKRGEEKTQNQAEMTGTAANDANDSDDEGGLRGLRFIRPVLRAFLIPSAEFPGEHHLCCVYAPALIDLDTLQSRLPGCVYDVASTRVILTSVLLALDALHRRAHIVHCDVKVDNLLCDALDADFYHGVAQQLQAERPVAKTIPSFSEGPGGGQGPLRRIYRSVSLIDHQESSADDPTTNALANQHQQQRTPPFNRVLLSDFGEAELGVSSSSSTSSSNPAPAPAPDRAWMSMCNPQYRPPEIHCQMRWGAPLDLWAVGIMAWKLLHDVFLFGGTLPGSRRRCGTTAEFLAEIHAVLGPPPRDFLARNQAVTARFWDLQTGRWKGLGGAGVQGDGWGRVPCRFVGREKEVFLAFVRKMVGWCPEERASARELLKDPWLTGKWEEEDADDGVLSSLSAGGGEEQEAN